MEGNPHGVYSCLIPCARAQLTINGEAATGSPFPEMLGSHQTSTACLAWSETWTHPALIHQWGRRDAGAPANSVSRSAPRPHPGAVTPRSGRHPGARSRLRSLLEDGYVRLVSQVQRTGVLRVGQWLKGGKGNEVGPSGRSNRGIDLIARQGKGELADVLPEPGDMDLDGRLAAAGTLRIGRTARVLDHFKEGDGQPVAL